MIAAFFNMLPVVEGDNVGNTVEGQEAENIGEGVSSEEPGSGRAVQLVRIIENEGILLFLQRRYPYPLRIEPPQGFRHAVIGFLMWPRYYRSYSWEHMDLPTALTFYGVQNRRLEWRPRSWGMQPRSDLRKPLFIVIFYGDAMWALIYKQDLRRVERRRRHQFFFLMKLLFKNKSVVRSFEIIIFIIFVANFTI